MSIVEVNENTLSNVQNSTGTSLACSSYELTGHTGAVNSISFSNNGKHMISGGRDGNCLIWDVFPYPQNIDVAGAHNGEVLDTLFTHDDEYYGSCGTDKRAVLYNFETNTLEKEMLHRTDVTCMDSNGRGPHQFVTGTEGGICYLWDMRQSAPCGKIATNMPICSVKMSCGGDMVYSAGVDELIHAWDLRQNKEVFTLPGHVNTITGIALSTDETLLVSNSTDNSIRVWDVRPFVSEERLRLKRAIGRYGGHIHDTSQNLVRVAINNDASYVATGSIDGNVYIWDVLKYTLLYKLANHQSSVTDVIFHPTQKIIASAGIDGKISVNEYS